MKRKNLFIIVLSLMTVISFIIGFSYAYFTTVVIGNDTASSNITTSGSLKLNFNGLDYIDLQNSQPGDTDSITFTVTNSGSLPVTAYLVNFSNVINTFEVKSEMVYEIDCVSSDAVTCLDKVETEIPSVSGVAITQTSIAPGTTHTYTLTVTFTDTGSLQDYNQDKMLTFKVTIDEQFDIPVLVASTGSADARYFWGYKTSITSVTFEDGIDVPAGAFASWDVSEVQNGSIMAYIIDDGLGASTYELYFQTNNDLVLANPNSSYLFYNFTNLATINNLSLFNTSAVTSMAYMFQNCNDLTSLDLSNFSTTIVTTMSSMFYGCSTIASLDLSSFDTNDVGVMTYMFRDCLLLTSIDISNFDTSSVTLAHGMFRYCSSLTSLDLSNFDTSSMTNMYAMFLRCTEMISLDLSSFDTSSVTSMDSMFGNCENLTTLNIRSFNTSSVELMSYMFSSCVALTDLDLGSFDTSSVTNMQNMFSWCSDLTSLDLSNFDTSAVTNMLEMFFDCSGLIIINLRIADFTTVTTYTSMFLDITNGINIVVKDATAETFINARLVDASKNGTVTIYV